MARTGNPNWKKGVSPNPKGRPPIILPALQQEIDQNRNALKQLIIRYLALTDEQIAQKLSEPQTTAIETMLARCIQETSIQGDVDRFRKLLEIVFGKLPEEKHEFDVSAEEKELVMEYRRRLQLQGPKKE